MVPLLRRHECSGVSAVEGDCRSSWVCLGAMGCLWEMRLWGILSNVMIVGDEMWFGLRLPVGVWRRMAEEEESTEANL